VIAIVILGIDCAQNIMVSIAEYVCKKEAAENLAKAKGVSYLKVPVADGARWQGKKEIWIDGCLYDIGTVYKSKDSLTVTLFQDRDEESLVEGLLACFTTDQVLVSGNSGDHFCKTMRPNLNDCKEIPAHPFQIACNKSVNCLKIFGAHFTLGHENEFMKSHFIPPERVVCKNNC